MKKTFLFVFFPIFFLVGVWSCNNSDGGTTDLKKTDSAAAGVFKGRIKVGHLVALDMAPLFVAKEKGYFKEAGMDVETVFFSNPGDNNAALAGGSLQFSTNPFTLPYFAQNSGIPMRIISGAGGLGIIEVVIQGSLNVNTVKELVAYIKAHPGKKLRIAVLKGDTLEMIIQKMLADNGLTYSDVEMVWFNDLLAMVQSFQTKQVDILSYIKPYTTNMIVNFGAKSLTTSTEVWGEGTPNCTVAVMQDFIKKYPATCTAYLECLEKGFHFMVDSPAVAADLLIKGNYYKVDKSVLLYAMQNQPKKVTLRPNQDGMMLAINAMVKAGYIKQPDSNIVDLTFLDQVEK